MWWCIGFALCVCVCLSGCQKLIISSLHHILHSPGGLNPFRHVRLPFVCLSVRAQKVHLKGLKLLKLTWKFELGMLGMRYSRVHDHPMVPVRLTGRTDTFWDGLRCLSGAFCPFNGLRSTPNHFQTLFAYADEERNFTYGALWLVSWPVFTNIELSLSEASVMLLHMSFERLFPVWMCSLLTEKFWNTFPMWKGLKNTKSTNT